MTTITLDRIVKNKQNTCLHEFKNYKQSIRVTNDAFDRRHHHPYFIVRGCPKCHKKYVIDYHIN